MNNFQYPLTSVIKLRCDDIFDSSCSREERCGFNQRTGDARAVMLMSMWRNRGRGFQRIVPRLWCDMKRFRLPHKGASMTHSSWHLLHENHLVFGITLVTDTNWLIIISCRDQRDTSTGMFYRT